MSTSSANLRNALTVISVDFAKLIEKDNQRVKRHTELRSLVPPPPWIHAARPDARVARNGKPIASTVGVVAVIMSDAPDWPSKASASDYPEGTRKAGSTGQVWQVRDGQWVRLTTIKLVSGSDDAPR